LPYLDTSIIVPYYVPAKLTPVVMPLITTMTKPTISELVELEFTSTLSRLVRTGDLAQDDAREVIGVFEDHVAMGLFERLQLNTHDYLLAKSYIKRFDLPLKGPDALHVALADRHGLELYTADEKMAKSAQVLGVGTRYLETPA
jgi:predicted nucleic acid-binding protein